MSDYFRPICVTSAPVTTFVDELAQELLRRFPRDTCEEILRKTLATTQDKLLAQKVRNRKSDAYKATLLAKVVAKHLEPLSLSLTALLGEGKIAPEDVGVTVEPGNPSPEEDFLSDLEIPTFDDYKSIFDKYPFVNISESKSLGKLIVLGYVSGRGRTSNKLYRRNCLVVYPDGSRKSFNDLDSVIGYLKSSQTMDGSKPHIKGIPYADGTGIKFWTNIRDDGDLQSQYRYVLYTDLGRQDYLIERNWEGAMQEYRNKPKIQVASSDPVNLFKRS